jgi:hypothetical protein
MTSNVLDDDSISWWHGQIEREQAEFLLANGKDEWHYNCTKQTKI